MQLRIMLEEVHPPVWRRLLVPGGARLDKLHRMLQAAMGWEDRHLHGFRAGEALSGAQFDECPDEELDEKSVTVASSVGEQRRFAYEYDFGDSWRHEVVVEAAGRMPIGLKFAVCVDGQNACPPEDCGGTLGYAELLDVLADPEHEDHEHFLSWVGGAFDPTEFDLGSVNARLQRVR